MEIPFLTVLDLPIGSHQFAIFVLVSASVGALLLAFGPGTSEHARLQARAQGIATPRKAVQGKVASGDDSRRRAVEETLRELEARQRAKARRVPKPTLTGRMRQAGLNWNKSTYLTASLFVGLMTFALAFNAFGIGAVPSVWIGVAGALLLPHLYVARRRANRMKAFSTEFPDALDVIVRGVQAGLPLGDCLRIIASEAQEPVCSEFRGLVHDQTLGVPLDEAVERLTHRVPLSETNFFAIVLTIQSRTGGNLSEAIGNLSKVLRERKNMRGKIKALSAEAKASAGIIACMPLGVAVLLYFASPDYISLLFTTSTGHTALAGSGVWMLIGIGTMKKMINFDF